MTQEQRDALRVMPYKDLLRHYRKRDRKDLFEDQNWDFFSRLLIARRSEHTPEQLNAIENELEAEDHGY